MFRKAREYFRDNTWYEILHNNRVADWFRFIFWRWLCKHDYHEWTAYEIVNPTEMLLICLRCGRYNRTNIINQTWKPGAPKWEN